MRDPRKNELYDWTCGILVVSAALLLESCLPPKCPCGLAWTNDSGASQERLSYRCADYSVTVRIWASVVRQIGRWREVLSLEIRNDGADSVYFDWRTGSVILQDTIRIAPVAGYSGEGWNIPVVVAVRPRHTQSLMLVFADSTHLAEYRASPSLEYRVGDFRRVDHTALCSPPPFHVFTENPRWCPR